MSKSKTVELIIKEFFPEYDLEGDEDYKDDFWCELTEKQTYDINAVATKRIGNPKYDYLICYEPGRFDEGVEVTDYRNMYEVDLEWWKFQRDSQLESIKKYINMPDNTQLDERQAEMVKRVKKDYEKYSIYLSGDWYRLIDDGRFLYAEFVSAKWHIYYMCENLMDELQEENIPYDFRESENGDFVSILNEDDPTKRYDANGREVELESYLELVRKYQSNELMDKIENIVNKYAIVFSGKTFRQDKGYEEGENFDPYTHFVFFDEKSLMNVAPQHFLETFANCQVDYVEFQKVIDETLSLVREDHEKIYQTNKTKYEKE